MTTASTALLLLSLLGLGIGACAGGSAERAPKSSAPAVTLAVAPAPTPQPNAPSSPQTRVEAANVVTYVEIDRGWVEAHVPAPPALVKAWAADPAHAKWVLPRSRHVLIRSSVNDPPAARAAARRTAMAALARVTRGEDFAKVARLVSEDPGSKDNGGAYPGEMVAQFVEPYRAAYAALAPGQFTKKLVETDFGFHIIKKDPVDDFALFVGYRRATEAQATRRLTDELAERLKPAHAEASAPRIVREVVSSVLGSEAAAGDSGPAVHVMPLAKVPPPPHGETCAKLIAIPSGAVVVMPIDHDDGLIVAKAGTDADADPIARGVAAPGDTADGVSRYCSAGSAEALTPAVIRDLLEKAQRAQKHD